MPPPTATTQLTARVTRQFCDVFERDVAVYFVATGTAANLLCLQANARPSGYVLCTEQAHIYADEFNGPEFVTGMKLVPVADHRRADDRRHAAGEAWRRCCPRISAGRWPPCRSPTPPSTAPRTPPRRSRNSPASPRRAGMAVHVDGARFANAVAATGDSPADLTWRAGADLMSFGGTKNGCWAAEAVVVFDPAAYPDLMHLRQRAGHGLSKQRFIAAQYDGYFADDAWLATATHANAMAARLADGLAAHDSVRFEWRSTTNEVFPILPSRDCGHAARRRCDVPHLGAARRRGDDPPRHVVRDDRGRRRRLPGPALRAAINRPVSGRSRDRTCDHLLVREVLYR